MTATKKTTTSKPKKARTVTVKKPVSLDLPRNPFIFEILDLVSKQRTKTKKIEVLNLKGISTIADYFVICTVDSLPQLKALRRDVDKEIKTIHSVTPRAIEGTPESLWLIIDYVDVIFHIFHDDLRTTYSLEELWSDASRLELDFLNAE